MKLKIWLLFFVFLLFSDASFSRPVIYVLKVEGIINPVVTQYINRGINRAEDNRAEGIIIQLNTPGGLDTSMRKIVERMFESKVPTVVYVAPAGARAASAGIFICLAADIIAMADGTNLGAAHPVAFGEKMSKTISDKVTNDAAAYARALAKKRKRDMKFAEDAVRKSKSIPVEEALKIKFVDIRANNLKTLLHLLHKREVKGKFGKRILNTKDAEIVYLNMRFQEKFLHDISHPNIAYILMMIATYGLIYELANPGSILPGVVGAISLLLALFALESLSINLAGLFLILLGIGLFIIELKTPGFGVLLTGGVISLFLGSLMLFSSSGPYLTTSVSLEIIITFVALTAIFFLVIINLAIKALKGKVLTGPQAIVGKVGISKTALSPYGTVLVYGEDWEAEAISEDIKEGEKVKVVEVDGLKLKVSKY